MQRPVCRNDEQALWMCISGGYTFTGKAVEIRGLNLPVAVSTEMAAVLSIRGDNNDIPGKLSVGCRAFERRDLWQWLIGSLHFP